jgi:hypothetical protein
VSAPFIIGAIALTVLGGLWVRNALDHSDSYDDWNDYV